MYLRIFSIYSLFVSLNTITATPLQTAQRAQLHRQLEDKDDNDDDDDNIVANEGDDLRAFFPTSFGGGGVGGRKTTNSTTATKKQQQQIEEPEIGPPPPPPETYDDDDDDNDKNGTTNTNTNTNNDIIPIASEAFLQTQHTRVVTALALDHSGTRLLTGANDYGLCLFDFAGMKSDCRPFKRLEPSEGHPILSLSWSPSSDAFMVVTASAQPKVYDREGKSQGELPRGDMYIRDLKNTKGHITSCRGGQWHPSDKGTGLTCSEDGTLRVWDLWGLVQKTVIKPTPAKPGRVTVSCCGWSPGDGKVIGGGLEDGSIQIWDVRGKFGTSAAVGAVGAANKSHGTQKQTWTVVSTQPGRIVRGAHAQESSITCLLFSRDGATVVSRGGGGGEGGCVKTWDLRKFKHPMAVAEDLPTSYDNTGMCFSPDEKLILTGISAPPPSSRGGSGSGHTSSSGNGSVVFLDRDTLHTVRRVGVPEESAVAVQWNARINQIVVGGGDRKQGSVRVWYDAKKGSVRGAIAAVGRRPRVDTSSDFTAAPTTAPQIYVPNALPLYREDLPPIGPGAAMKRRLDANAEAVNKRASKRPEFVATTSGVMGAGGKGAQGTLGVSNKSLLTQYIMKHQGEIKNPGEEDVRASILRHAGKEDEFLAYTAAYAKTQPERLYAVEESEEEGEEKK